MSISNEEHIEEILYEAHAYGFRDEMFKLVKQYEIDYPKMSQLDRYQKSYEVLITKYNEL
tara:strand:- start:387 stop:566 length:180 start_codon:yes stop_codon:yes gene_type:complete